MTPFNITYKIKIYSFYSFFIKEFLKTFNKKFKNKKSFNLNIQLNALPKKIKKYTVLRSPHINKKSKEQFEIRMHKIVIYLNNILNIDQINHILIYFKNIINIGRIHSFMPIKLKIEKKIQL